MSSLIVLVLTDLGMPGMFGWQVAEKIKSINGRVSVVLVTGWDIKQGKGVYVWLLISGNLISPSF
jgi:CheY-like chemotaxis protein